MRERTRLAANLHDTLLQTMAGIAYQLDACGQVDRPESEESFGKHLETASRMVQHGQDNLRNTVWRCTAFLSKRGRLPIRCES